MQFRTCPLCDDTPTRAGLRFSQFSKRTFHYGYCKRCDLGLVLDPRTDYENIYNAPYYSGMGADPYVDYTRADIGRCLEFEGLRKFGEVLVNGRKGRWLDFGGGLGEFTAYLRSFGWEAYAHDEGFASEQLQQKGLKWNKDSGEKFDVVSAIEVVEHLIDPLPVIATMAEALTPGGTLLITTGNLEKAPPLARWKYAAIPEVHVTFWTPKSWATALTAAGLVPTKVGPFDPAVTQYKVIKNLSRFKKLFRNSAAFWRLPAKLIDQIYGVSAFPVGKKIGP